MEEFFSQDDKIELPENLLKFINNINKETIFKSDKNLITDLSGFLNLIREIPKETESKLGFLKQGETLEDKDRVFIFDCKMS